MPAGAPKGPVERTCQARTRARPMPGTTCVARLSGCASALAPLDPTPVSSASACTRTRSRNGPKADSTARSAGSKARAYASSSTFCPVSARSVHFPCTPTVRQLVQEASARIDSAPAQMRLRCVDIRTRIRENVQSGQGSLAGRVGAVPLQGYHRRAAPHPAARIRTPMASFRVELDAPNHIVLVMVQEDDGKEHDYQFDFDPRSGRYEFSERDLLERDFGSTWVEELEGQVRATIQKALARPRA